MNLSSIIIFRTFSLLSFLQPIYKISSKICVVIIQTLSTCFRCVTRLSPSFSLPIKFTWITVTTGTSYSFPLSLRFNTPFISTRFTHFHAIHSFSWSRILHFRTWFFIHIFRYERTIRDIFFMCRLSIKISHLSLYHTRYLFDRTYRKCISILNPVWTHLSSLSRAAHISSSWLCIQSACVSDFVLAWSISHKCAQQPVRLFSGI